MKKLLIGLAILTLLLAAVVVVAVSNVNQYLNENRETISDLASERAGRKISFENANVAFSNGLAVRLAGLTVAEDERFGQAPFLVLEDAFVGLRILPALQRRIEVSGVRLDSPTIRLIRSKRGFNFSTLGVPKDESGGDPPEPSSEASPFAVAIAALEIVDGTVHYEDRRSSDGLSLVIDDFKSSGTDLVLDGPIAIDFEGRARSTRPGDEGLASWIEGALRLESLTSPTASSPTGTLSLESPRFHPALLGVRLEESGPAERLDDFEVEIGLPPDPGTSGYPVKLRSTTARLSGFDLSSGSVDLVYLDVRRGSKLRLDQVLLGLAGGRLEMTGDVVLGERGRSPFDLKAKLSDLDSGELATVLLDVPVGAVSGRLGGDIDLAGDSLDWETLKQSLAGDLRLDISEGALEQVNLLNRLIAQLTRDPGLGQLAAASLREAVPSSLSGDRTPFDGVNMALEILDGAVHAKDLELRAGEFALEAVGQLGLDGALSADGRILFSEDVSRKILAKADQLAPLLGDGDQVALPLRFDGTAGAPKVAPDLSALTTKATAELQDRAVKELSDVLFGKKRDDDEPDPERDANRDSTEGLIREGLGRLLGR